MSESLSILKDLTIEDVTKNWSDLIQEKSDALNTVNIAVNQYVRLKNEYIVKSNELRLKPDNIKKELDLSKLPTEKQQQAYIDDKLKNLIMELRIAEENVKSWKREVDLLDDKIAVEKYRVKMLMGVVDGLR